MDTKEVIAQLQQRRNAIVQDAQARINEIDNTVALLSPPPAQAPEKEEKAAHSGGKPAQKEAKVIKHPAK